MAAILVKHITKLTAMILILAALAASAFIQAVHARKLQGDAAALKLIVKRVNTPRTDDAALLERARSWLREHDKAAADLHDDTRQALVEGLRAAEVPEEVILEVKGLAEDDSGASARWALLQLDLGPEGAIDALVPEDSAPETVADMLGGFLAGHRSTKLTAATGADLGEVFRAGVEEAKGIRLESVLLRGESVEIRFSEKMKLAMNQRPPRAVQFGAPAKVIRTDSPSIAELTFGRNEEAEKLAADPGRIKRLLRLYGDLSMGDAQGTVSRVLTARFNAVSLLGVQVPAEYFAVALGGGLAAVMFGLVTALRRAQSARATPLDFMQSDAVSALMLASGAGRVALWLVLPVAAAAAVWPDAWLDRAWFNVYRIEIVAVAVLGIWAVGLGRVVTRG